MAETNTTMVMRSVYLPPEMDSALRSLAFQLRLSKADLIRAFVASGMKEVQRRLGSHPDEAAIAQVARSLGDSQLSAQEIQHADAVMKRMQAAVTDSQRSYATDVT